MLTDAKCNLLVYRSFGSTKTNQAASIIDKAVQEFKKDITGPEFASNSKVQTVRGGFPACSIGSHKSYVSVSGHPLIADDCLTHLGSGPGIMRGTSTIKTRATDLLLHSSQS